MPCAPRRCYPQYASSTALGVGLGGVVCHRTLSHGAILDLPYTSGQRSQHADLPHQHRQAPLLCATLRAVQPSPYPWL